MYSLGMFRECVSSHAATYDMQSGSTAVTRIKQLILGGWQSGNGLPKSLSNLTFGYPFFRRLSHARGQSVRNDTAFESDLCTKRPSFRRSVTVTSRESKRAPGTSLPAALNPTLNQRSRSTGFARAV